MVHLHVPRLDCTLRELMSLIREVNPETRQKGTLFAFATVYPDRRGVCVCVCVCVCVRVRVRAFVCVGGGKMSVYRYANTKSMMFFP